LTLNRTIEVEDEDEVESFERIRGGNKNNLLVLDE